MYLAEALSRRTGRTITLAEIGLASKTTGRAETPTDPVTAIADLGRADVDRRTVLGSAVYSLAALLEALAGPEPGQRTAGRSRRTPTVGAADVEAVRNVIAAFNAADERLGGGHGRSAVAEYLRTDVTAYLKGSFATADTRAAMFGLAAQLAYIAGWKAHDLGASGTAQRWYLQAVSLARESSPTQTAYCMRILAHQAMDLGHHEHCADLADTALSLTRGQVDPDTESLFWLTAARARAAAGDKRKALEMLRRAEAAIGRSTGEPPPAWVALGGPAQARLANHTGKTLAALGDLASAETQFAAAARCWDPVTHPRIHALTLAELAETQCDRGHLDEACRTWNRALDTMTGIRSARTREAARDMRRRLATYRRRIPAAAQVDARAANLLAN